jgi:hypothetical protein
VEGEVTMASDLTRIDWKGLIRKYGLDGGVQCTAVSDEVRQDLHAVMQYAYTLQKQNENVTAALDGSKETMMAVAKASGGYLDILYDTIEKLGKNDALVVEDMLREDGVRVKRFTYVPENMMVN